jgi:hypothetical protein
MTGRELQEIKARCEAASPGPWVVGDITEATYYSGKNGVVSVGNRLVAYKGGVDVNDLSEGDLQTFADMEFIAAARSDIPALLAEVERLGKLLNLAREVLQSDINHKEVLSLTAKLTALLAEVKRLTRERDAAVNDFEEYMDAHQQCWACKNHSKCGDSYNRHACWQWRGVQDDSEG